MEIILKLKSPLYQRCKEEEEDEGVPFFALEEEDDEWCDHCSEITQFLGEQDEDEEEIPKLEEVLSTFCELMPEQMKRKVARIVFAIP